MIIIATLSFLVGFSLGLFAFCFWLCAVDDCAVSLPTKRDAT